MCVGDVIMRINKISNYVYQNSNLFLKPKVSVKSNSNLSFRGEPWQLHPYKFGISDYGSITAYEAETLYKSLACGNYLDIGEDKTKFEYCNRIRENNLAFLDRVTSPSEQKKFIEHYKWLTGFPCLELVSEKIKKQFVDAVKKASQELYYSKYNVEQAGYDGVCSVGRKKALPGSDLDKAYVIIRGTGDSYDDIECVNQFKGRIWNNTDQRILSYNHDEAAFPQVYTLAQLKKLVNAAEEKAQGQNRYNSPRLSNIYDKDYVRANQFYIKICNEFPNFSYDGINKESIKNIGFVLEAMREGVTFGDFGKIYDSSITDSLVYKFVNLSQLKALKQHNDRKPKRLARESLRYGFANWSIDKQFRFVKTLIKSACANNREFTTEFSQYFSKPGQDLFAPLIKALMR